MRYLGAVAILVVGAVHLQQYLGADFYDIPTIGPLFLLNVIAGLVLGVVVVSWRHWLPALAAAGFGAATVLAFWISVVHGLFGLKETPTGSAQVLAEVAEYVAVAFGLVAAAGLWHRPRRAVAEPTAGPARMAAHLSSR
jgi:hypothetical protein